MLELVGCQWTDPVTGIGTLSIMSWLLLSWSSRVLHPQFDPKQTKKPSSQEPPKSLEPNVTRKPTTTKSRWNWWNRRAEKPRSYKPKKELKLKKKNRKTKTNRTHFFPTNKNTTPKSTSLKGWSSIIHLIGITRGEENGYFDGSIAGLFLI